MSRMQLVVAAIGLAVIAGSSGKMAADDGKAGGMGRLESPTGTLLRREGADKEWKAVANGAGVPDGQLLLALPGVRATIKSSSGAVRLTLSGNVPQLSPLP